METPMLDQFVQIAAKQVGKVLASDAAAKVLSSPQLQQVVVTAINARATVRDAAETTLKQVASKLDLPTKDDVAKVRRKVRDLEDTVAELREQLEQTQAAQATDGAAGETADAKPAATRKARSAKAKA
jgi:polyhydroxyalkanoate synthesis regulator phasin